jgi:hypothetical protein
MAEYTDETFGYNDKWKLQQSPYTKQLLFIENETVSEPSALQFLKKIRQQFKKEKRKNYPYATRHQNVKFVKRNIQHLPNMMYIILP